MSAPTDFVRFQCGLENDPLSRLVLFCISFFVNYTTGECWPSVATLSKESNLCENTVRKRIKELEKLGYIKVTERENASKVITLVGYKDWIDKALKRQPAPPSRDEPLHGVNPFTACAEPLHAVNPPPSRGEPEIYNLNILNKSFNKKNAEANTICGSEEETRVFFHNEQIKLCDELNQLWLRQFDGQQDDLNLALIQIAAYVQPNSPSRSLEAQVSSQLARIVRDRKDKDKRYAAAAKNKPSNGKFSYEPPKKKSYCENADEIWAKLDRGEL